MCVLLAHIQCLCIVQIEKKSNNSGQAGCIRKISDVKYVDEEILKKSCKDEHCGTRDAEEFIMKMEFLMKNHVKKI